MKAIIHIGTHKTATTSIQRLFTDQNSAAHDLGVLYPCNYPLPRQGEHAHHELFRLIRDSVDETSYKQHAQKMAAKFLERYDNHWCIVISSEGFSNLRTDAQLKRLLFFLEQLNPTSVKVICYFRELIDYANTAFRQKIQSTNSVPRSFATYVESYDRTIYPIADFWTKVGDLNFELFQQDRFYGGDIIADFLLKIGGHEFLEVLLPLYLNKAENPSIGGLLLVAKIAWNAMGVHIPYGLCGQLAGLSPDFRLPCWVPATFSDRLRASSIRNKSLRQMMGDLKEKPFSSYCLADSRAELIEKTRIFFSRDELRQFPIPDTDQIRLAASALSFYE